MTVPITVTTTATGSTVEVAPDLRALAESGLSAADIAARTGLSLSAVRGRLRRLGVRLASAGPGRPRKDGTRSRVVLQLPLSAEEHAGLVVAAAPEDVATWAHRRLLESAHRSKAAPADITFTRRDVDLAAILDSIEGEPADMVRTGGNPRSALTPR